MAMNRNASNPEIKLALFRRPDGRPSVLSRSSLSAIKAAIYDAVMKAKTDQCSYDLVVMISGGKLIPSHKDIKLKREHLAEGTMMDVPIGPNIRLNVGHAYVVNVIFVGGGCAFTLDDDVFAYAPQRVDNDRNRDDSAPPKAREYRSRYHGGDREGNTGGVHVAGLSQMF